MQSVLSELTEKNFHKVKNTLSNLFIILIPTTLNFGCILLLNFINIFFISSKYNDIKMIDAIGASNLYVMCTSFITTYGIVLTMDTLVSNALAANQKYLMGLYVNRARVIALTIIIISILINRIFALDIIFFLTNDIEIVNLSKAYIFKYNMALLIDLGFRINMNYLCIVNKSIVNSCILSATTFLHLLWCYIFINKLDMGVVGVAYATFITQSLNLICSGIYIYYYNPYPEVNFFINKDCFRGWKEYLRVALPITSMLIGEWTGYEIQAVIAMKVGAFDYSVYLILFTIESVFKSYGIGLSVAVGIRLAESIVANDIDTCKFNLKVWYMFSKVSILLMSILLYSFRKLIIHLFVIDVKTAELLSEIFYLMCLYSFLENGRLFLGGVFRGLSYLTVPSMIQIFFNYVVTILLSYYLALKLGYGVKGMWMAFVISYLILYCIFTYITYNIDLEFLKMKTLKRLEEDSSKIINNADLNLLKITKEENQNVYEMMKV